MPFSHALNSINVSCMHVKVPPLMCHDRFFSIEYVQLSCDAYLYSWCVLVRSVSLVVPPDNGKCDFSPANTLYHESEWWSSAVERSGLAIKGARVRIPIC